MAFTFITPMTPEAETMLVAEGTRVQLIVRQEVRRIWNRPDEDIITTILRCPVLIPDAVAIKLGKYPDILIQTNTSDDLRALAMDLTEAIKARLKAELNLSFEIWIRFFEAWGTNLE